MGFGQKILLGGYGLLWRAVRPLLRRNKRLTQGFELRLVPPGWPWTPLGGVTQNPTHPVEAAQNNPVPDNMATAPAFDLWIQAASGGEAYLAGEVIKNLAASGPMRVLCTTWTSQGLDVLLKIQREFSNAETSGLLSGSAAGPQGLDICVNYFPLDDPKLMRRALRQSGARVLVLLETEIWPGLLAACREVGTQVIIINGRMTEKSLAGYSKIKGLAASLGPQKVLAVSQADAERFSKVFPGAEVGIMPNIKFDRLELPPELVDASARGTAEGAADSPAKKRTPLIVLASVREEEEPLLAPVISELLKKAPQAAIVLAPRHMHRVAAWEALLSGNAEHSVGALKRSVFSGPPEEMRFTPGSVVLWDVFGELDALYRLADAVFVGGSLAPLGGQNFLEPMRHGLAPCIGPYWDNFHWAGEEIFASGLARRVSGSGELAGELLALLSAPQPRAEVKENLREYLTPRRGGGILAARAVLEHFNFEML